MELDVAGSLQPIRFTIRYTTCRRKHGKATQDTGSDRLRRALAEPSEITSVHIIYDEPEPEPKPPHPWKVALSGVRGAAVLRAGGSRQRKLVRIPDAHLLHPTKSACIFLATISR